MPILKHAKKKLIVDQKRAERNKVVRTRVSSAVKRFKLSLNKESLDQAFSALDRAAKSHVIHEGKANRLKSRLNKLLPKEVASVAEKVVKTTKKGVKVPKKISK